jgi:hypothetical protein
MVTASNEVFGWMTGEAHSDLPPEPYSAATRDVLPVIARHAFRQDELASWEMLRKSPQGQRGLALHELEVALVKVTNQLVDVNSERYWAWPLARLARLADALGLRRELDATFEMLEPGAGGRLRAISLVPGVTPADERFLGLVSRSGELLSERFMMTSWTHSQRRASACTC